MPILPNPPQGLSRRDFVGGLAAAAGFLSSPLATRALGEAGPSFRSAAMDLDRFIEQCVAANKGPDAQAAVLEVLAKAVRSPGALLAALGEPKEADIRVLHRSASLTIFNATWTPQMNLMPHNHLMWANIGLYTGREDNLLWRKTQGSLEAYGAKALFAQDVLALPADVIHSVTNPLPRFTGGIHIYGGDFFATARSLWNPETRAEEPSNGDVIKEIFRRENAKLRQRVG